MRRPCLRPQPPPRRQWHSLHVRAQLVAAVTSRSTGSGVESAPPCARSTHDEEGHEVLPNFRPPLPLVACVKCRGMHGPTQREPAARGFLARCWPHNKQQRMSFFGVHCPTTGLDPDLVVRRLRTEHGASFSVVGLAVTLAGEPLLVLRNTGPDGKARGCCGNVRLRGVDTRVVEVRQAANAVALCVDASVSGSLAGPALLPAHICSGISDAEGFVLLPGLHATVFTAPSAAAAARVCSPGWQAVISNCSGGSTAVRFAHAWEVLTPGPQATHDDNSAAHGADSDEAMPCIVGDDLNYCEHPLPYPPHLSCAGSPYRTRRA